MGFSLGDIAKVGAVLNPVATIGTALQGGLDFYQADKNREAQEEANKANVELAREQIAAQREFAQHGIRWKAEDAVRAGLHPLAALGTNGPSFSPVSASIMAVQDDRASAFSRMGQNLTQAYLRTANEDERVANKLRLENMSLQNDLLRSQISSINNPTNPPMPVGGSSNFIDGQGNSGIMVVKPSERTMSQPDRAAQEAGWRPDVSFSRTDTGLTPMIPQGLSESLEDDIIGKVMWRIRNQVMPNFTGQGAPGRSMLPRGAKGWKWNRLKQEWQPSFVN